jgi:di/tricarboxylate transporter
MNAETSTQEVAKTPPKSKRLSSLIWIVVLWVGVRLFSELHPIYWTHMFFGVVIDSGLVPASLALILAAMTKNTDSEKSLRWTAFGILFGVLCLGIILQVCGLKNYRDICIVVHWSLLTIGIWLTYSRVVNRGVTHGD